MSKNKNVVYCEKDNCNNVVVYCKMENCKNVVIDEGKKCTKCDFWAKLQAVAYAM